jgi:hypothetical protein
MRKPHYHFFDEPIVAEGLRQGSNFKIRRDLWQEMLGVELAHGHSAYPRGTGRNYKYIGVLGHGRESRIGIFEHEFSVGVLLPGDQHSLLVRCEVTHWELLSTVDEIFRLRVSSATSRERGPERTILSRPK